MTKKRRMQCKVITSNFFNLGLPIIGNALDLTGTSHSKSIKLFQPETGSAGNTQVRLMSPQLELTKLSKKIHHL